MNGGKEGKAVWILVDQMAGFGRGLLGRRKAVREEGSLEIKPTNHFRNPQSSMGQGSREGWGPFHPHYA